MSMKNLTVGLTSVPMSAEERYWTKTSPLLSWNSGMFLCVFFLLKGAWSKLLLNRQSKIFPWMLSNYVIVMMPKGTLKNEWRYWCFSSYSPFHINNLHTYWLSQGRSNDRHSLHMYYTSPSHTKLALRAKWDQTDQINQQPYLTVSFVWVLSCTSEEPWFGVCRERAGGKDYFCW